jgi:hypothetical protein
MKYILDLPLLVCFTKGQSKLDSINTSLKFLLKPLCMEKQSTFLPCLYLFSKSIYKHLPILILSILKSFLSFYSVILYLF